MGRTVRRVRGGVVTAPRQYGRMVVLHAAWLADPGRLALWAEDRNGPRATPARRGRATRRPRPHPFALDPEGLRLAVDEIAGTTAADRLGEEPVELTLRLPGTGGSPIGSPLDDEPLAGAVGGPRRVLAVGAGRAAVVVDGSRVCPRRRPPPRGCFPQLSSATRRRSVPRRRGRGGPCRGRARSRHSLRGPRGRDGGGASRPGSPAAAISNSSPTTGGRAGGRSSTGTTGVGSRRWCGLLPASFMAVLRARRPWVERGEADRRDR